MDDIWSGPALVLVLPSAYIAMVLMGPGRRRVTENADCRHDDDLTKRLDLKFCNSRSTQTLLSSVRAQSALPLWPLQTERFNLFISFRTAPTFPSQCLRRREDDAAAAHAAGIDVVFFIAERYLKSMVRRLGFWAAGVSHKFANFVPALSQADKLRRPVPYSSHWFEFDIVPSVKFSTARAPGAYEKYDGTASRGTNEPGEFAHGEGNLM